MIGLSVKWSVNVFKQLFSLNLKILLLYLRYQLLDGLLFFNDIIVLHLHTLFCLLNISVFEPITDLTDYSNQRSLLVNITVLC